jgi:hypothetical protein
MAINLTESEMFDGPIPGSSLTRELGAEKHERPPVYTDPVEAFEFVVDGILSEEAAEKISLSAQIGVPAELIARSIVVTGWAEGYYTIDVLLLIFQPVFGIVMKLLDKAGIKYEKLALRKIDSRLEDAFAELERLNSKDILPEDEYTEDDGVFDEEELNEETSTGLMGRR